MILVGRRFPWRKTANKKPTEKNPWKRSGGVAKAPGGWMNTCPLLHCCGAFVVVGEKRESLHFSLYLFADFLRILKEFLHYIWGQLFRLVNWIPHPKRVGEEGAAAAALTKAAEYEIGALFWVAWAAHTRLAEKGRAAACCRRHRGWESATHIVWE